MIINLAHFEINPRGRVVGDILSTREDQNIRMSPLRLALLRPMKIEKAITKLGLSTWQVLSIISLTSKISRLLAYRVYNR